MKIPLEMFTSEVFPLAVSTVYRSMPGDTEVDLIEHFFVGKKLTGVHRESLLGAYHGVADMSSIPTFMSDVAFAFFLPSLMQAALDGQDDVDTQLPDLGGALCRQLLDIAEGGRTSQNRKAALLTMYSPTQLHVIALFLEEMRDHEKNKWPEGNVEEWSVAAQALSLFWNRYA